MIRLIVLAVAAGCLWGLFLFLQSHGLGAIAGGLVALYVAWSADTIIGHNAQLGLLHEQQQKRRAEDGG